MGITAELLRPKTVRNDHLYAVHVILLGRVQASQVGLDSQHRKKVVRNGRAIHIARFALPCPGISPTRQEISEVFKRVALGFVVFKLRHGSANSGWSLKTTKPKATRLNTSLISCRVGQEISEVFKRVALGFVVFKLRHGSANSGWLALLGGPNGN